MGAGDLRTEFEVMCGSQSRYFRIFVFASIALAACVLADVAYGARPLANRLDFSAAKIVVTRNPSAQEQTAVQMLVQEIYKRTKLRLPVTSAWPSTTTPVIDVVLSGQVKTNHGPFSPILFRSATIGHGEGFTVKLDRKTRDAPTIVIIGNDRMGVLFGIGYFLRKVTMTPFTGENHGQPGKLLVPVNLPIATYPRIPLRGIQLGYRPKTNSYDGFNVRMWQSYIRDLIVFGVNAVGLLPPHTDDTSHSPMFSLAQMDMMVRMDDILNKYGMQVWVWNPMMLHDYSNPKTVRKGLARERGLFSRLPKLDAVFVPGGDPGHTPPKIMFGYLKKEAKLLHRYHPHAQMWVSPQDFSKQWFKQFLDLLHKQPAWLAGVVYGPGIGMSIAQFRDLIPKRYRVRRYPDITHSFDSEYPVPNWAFAYAATENREVINPRPRQEATIFHLAKPRNYYGFVTYSEGINDDVNKMIWAQLGWNPKTKVQKILEDYSRYFIGPKYTYSFAQGLMDLERNWEGNLLDNASVPHTLLEFQGMNRDASPWLRLNWRFQEAMYRAYYDAYDRSRLLYEMALQDRAMGILREAPRLGSQLAMKQARKVLDQALTKPISGCLKRHVEALAEALFQSIHMQLGVAKYYAKSIGRGANLDLINYPLNDRIWLEQQFKRIRKLKSEKFRLAALHKIVNWKNPGPGGFYDNLGVPGEEPDLVKRKPYREDPAFLDGPFAGFAIGSRQEQWRTSWQVFGETLYDEPLSLHYTHLDPRARYVIRVVDSGNSFHTKMRLVANDHIVVHPLSGEDTAECCPTIRCPDPGDSRWIIDIDLVSLRWIRMSGGRSVANEEEICSWRLN